MSRPPHIPSKSLTAFVGVSMLACVGFELHSVLSSTRAQHAPAARVLGPWFFLGAAVALAAQLVWTTSKGCVFCGHTQTVEKGVSPALYRAWFGVHCLFIVFLCLVAGDLLRG